MENNIDKGIERCKELIKTEHANWIGLTNQDAIAGVLSDRETWKKIAEKLAEYIAEIDVSEAICENMEQCNEDCKQCALDWARNEVENE